jgi:hypothetical protein
MSDTYNIYTLMSGTVMSRSGGGQSEDGMENGLDLGIDRVEESM